MKILKSVCGKRYYIQDRGKTIPYVSFAGVVSQLCRYAKTNPRKFKELKLEGIEGNEREAIAEVRNIAMMNLDRVLG